ncbi:hypothetical protein HQ524_00625 [Candidatus Uhrbacteria bacterium]|nr:hypothetical protein [Candidatus Uhrbacteria bacterium]
MEDKTKYNKAWVVSVSMGYGHDRAAFPLRGFAHEGIVAANDYEGIPLSDKGLWKNSRKLYEQISRIREIPLVGEPIFEVMDHWQEIPEFYPERDLSDSSIQLKTIYQTFAKKQFLKHLITKKLAQKNLPLVTTYFMISLAAEYYGFPNEIHVILTDTDISRAWVSMYPQKSRIKYFAPSRRVVERLKRYGVPAENISLTGFPLPMENIGETKYSVLKKDLAARLVRLDPNRNYISRFEDSIGDHIGKLPKKSKDPITVMFAVGGAGAQRKMAKEIIGSLRDLIVEKKVRLLLSAGSRGEVAGYFRAAIRKFDLTDELGKGIDIVFDASKMKYFELFNEALRSTDVLWTKPSELSFYTGLGIPIIMAEPIGSQEDFNREWLQQAGSGIDQRDARYADEWLTDWFESGWLARAAMNGFLYAPKRGAYRVESCVANRACILPEPIEPI